MMKVTSAEEVMKRLILTVILLCFPLALVAEQQGIQGYPGFSKLLTEIDSLQAAGPEMVEVSEYGSSLDGRPLMAIRIYSPKSISGKPQALIAANIHGNELIGNRMAMAVAWRLVLGYGSDPWIDSLLEKTDIWVLPCLNPDGYFQTLDMMQRGDDAGHRKNMNDVDLNRNFPLPRPRKFKMEWVGSDDPQSVYYYGSEPLSEPETRELVRFLQQHDFFVSVNFHSVVGVIYPARCLNHACAKKHYQVGRALQKHQEIMKYRPVRIPYIFDMFTGEMEDMQYHEFGTLAVNVELGKPRVNRKDCNCKNKFWKYNPVRLEKQIRNDRDAVLYAIEKAFELSGGRPIPEPER